MVALLLIEQRRHDKTRDKYAEYERARQEIQRERIEADRDLTKVLSELSVRITMWTGHKP
jgi:hypothetical protein